MSKLQPSASITLEHAQRCIPKEHRQTGSEVSFRSLQSSDLRGDAAIFVPQKLSTAYRPELPKEWVQPCKPTVPFNPFELDVIYGIPLYYHMNHSVNVGDGTAFNYPNYPRHSPFKKGKNKRFYNGTKQSNHRKTRSTDTTLSPAKCYRTGDTGRAVETNEITVRPEEETTPRLLHATLAQSESSATGNMPAEAKSSPPKQSPFAQQMEIISTQVSRNASGTGRGPRHIDWGSIRNVRYNGQREAGYHYQTLPTIEDYTRGYHQHHQNQQQIGKNRTHANGRRGWHRSHDFNPPAGVPLDLTAPFPDPVAPPGPRPAGMNVEGGSPKQYVGYHISETQGCGKFEIEDGIEYGELSTLKCRSCAPDQ
jgi:hypothetical protein